MSSSLTIVLILLAVALILAPIMIGLIIYEFRNQKREEKGPSPE